MSGFAAAPTTQEPLIKLKYCAPPLRPGMIARPRLIARLNQGVHGALTLISAPAGYGKTTLLSVWVQGLRAEKAPDTRAVCWLSLDAGDNDPIRFLTYLTAALASTLPELGAEAHSLLQSDPSLPPTTPLSVLINELQDFSQPVILVLDDYQHISSATIHEGMIFLLEHLPENLHVVIATRSDPPLPLARLRGRNRLNELRAKDLRFTSDEAAAFLNQTFGLELTPEQVSALENRTEGWIAGLQMAAISMQGRQDTAQFIEVFSGSHRFIMDYLAEEVINRQPEEIQSFLLCTSILGRLSDPLCKAVLEGEPAGANATARDYRPGILQQLERTNLFVLPLDEDRTWYRYHHLFADLLRVRLKQTWPELIPALHGRAAAWFEEQGWVEEAIAHAQAARDWDRASRLIARNAWNYLDNGQMATVLNWIDGLPQDVIYRHATLCTLVAEVYAQAGRMDQIDPLLDRAEAIAGHVAITEEENEPVPALDLTRKEVTAICSLAASLRGLKAICYGDPARAVALTEQALAEFPEMEAGELAVLFWVQGRAHRSLGKLEQAIALLTRATEYALQTKRNFHDIWTDLGVATWQVGKLPQAIDIFTGSIRRAADRGVQNQGNLARDEAFLSLIYIEQNRLDLAFDYASRAIAHTQWWPSHHIIALAQTSIAQILLARGDIGGCLPAIQKADRERKNHLMTPFVHSMIDVTWARLRLLEGDWGWLDQWSGEALSALSARQDAGGRIDEALEMKLIMLARIWLEKTKIDRNTDRYGECSDLLSRLENSAGAAGRANALVEILYLKASAYHLQNNISAAVSCLEQCLALAEPGGYVRIFLNTGEPARELLSAYLRRTSALHRSYIQEVLEHFDGSLPGGDPQAGYPLAITGREMEVLRLLAQGCSNRQIAETLFLAEGTVKYHVHHLLQKLKVQSRTQALARAKDLGLI